MNSTQDRPQTSAAPAPDRLLRILFLEDSPTDARLTENELRRSGIAFSSVRVETEADFLKALEGCPFDLILSDVHLPEFDGREALAQARVRCPAIPFIFVTGTVGDEEAVETFKSGATDYVLKDHLARLAPAVRRALREKEEFAAGQAAQQAVKETNAQLQTAVAKLQKAQTMLIRNEKLAALGQLAAGVAHEIRNPLNIISSSVQLIQMERDKMNEDQKNTCSLIMQQVTRLTKITDNLRDFARERKPEITDFDLHAFLEKTIALVEYELKLDNVTFHRDFHPNPLSVKGDMDQLAQVFLNLINNAADSMKEKQEKAGRETLQKAGWQGLLIPI